MKNISKIGMAVVAGCMFAATSCSDYSDYNTVPEDAMLSANKTLWENISESENLQDFAAIIAKAGYTQNFSAPQYYTVWAPVDGTYDAQAILAKDSATIVKEFIGQHMATYSHVISGEVNKRIVSLNDKHHVFTNEAYDGIAIKTPNVATTNGVMHLLNGQSEYHPNLYEEIDNLKDCESFKAYIQKYDEYYLDVNNSVVGPMVDGKQTYLDSVFKKRNVIINNILNVQLENEDSSYTMLYPNDRAWELAYENISKTLNYYSGKLYYMDMDKNTTAAAACNATTAKCETPVNIDAAFYKDSLTKRAIVENLVFSNTYERNKPIWSGQLSSGKPDTLYTSTHSYITNIEDIYSHTVGDVKSNSNGYSRVMDSLCFYPWQTYEPVNKYLKPVRYFNLASGKKYTENNIIKSTLAGRESLFENVPAFIKRWILPENSEFFTYVSIDRENFLSTSSKVEFDFALDNALSTKYHIFVVTVPAQVKDPEAPLLPTHLRFDLSYTDATGTQKFQRLNVEGKKLTDDIITTPGKLSVIEFEFEFPISYYKLDAYPTLLMSHTKAFTTSVNRNKYDQELRVAGVFLVPETAYNYFKNITE